MAPSAPNYTFAGDYPKLFARPSPALIMRRVEKHLKRSSRSRPVSCLFCRSRKLRCSRQFPCPNCTSRGIACQLDASVAPSISTVDETLDQGGGDFSFQQDVLSRLRRLEEAVIGKGAPTPQPSSQTASQSSPAQPWHKDCSPASHAERPSTVDVDWLEGEVTYPASTSSLLSYEIEFNTCSITESTISTPAMDKNFPGNISTTRCVWLPLYEESKRIVEKYLANITCLHHVVHIPTVRLLVDEIYDKLHQKGPVPLGHVSLLLAILASTAFFWTDRDINSSLFPSVEEANRKSTAWMKIALEVLEYSRRKRSDSLEDIQAIIIVSFLTCNFVGITSQARHFFSTATSVAWQLGLHRIDHPNNAGLDIPPVDSVRAEIGRRIWWYLVATDWQLSRFAGSRKGTYSINPLHMATKKPLNANDEDLADGMIHSGQPINSPTSMSYCLQRIRLGELCREITDSIPFMELGAETPGYEQLRHIDARLCEFVGAMPPFFSLDYNARDIPGTDSRGILIQRYLLNSLVHAQRCRMHLPYLSKAATEPEYAYSKEACLEAARMVIRAESQLATESFPFVLTRLKFSGTLHCICMATIVFLMDLCLHKGLCPQADGARRAEILNAFGILEEAKDHSPFAEKILDSFHSVLRRHKIPWSSADGRTATRPDQPDFSEPVTHPTGLILSTNEMHQGNAVLEPNLPAFDDLWQTFDTSVDPASLVDWSTLFSELDSPFMSM
ncbi:uncharacterized protein N7459_005775 [Penicillium hispanicum]|uniref:uncharacterized protein n=1 Tax=Penicillium hispanicum TaxID=1080232 RepID=UPI002541822E|nr:uncharacterized protein N7459_005775 [Penicillium hispanicum]KAJ5579790.1 hypothetical protein N7459_005775 [Penicillium hispanicum]